MYFFCLFFYKMKIFIINIIFSLQDVLFYPDEIDYLQTASIEHEKIQVQSYLVMIDILKRFNIVYSCYIVCIQSNDRHFEKIQNCI